MTRIGLNLVVALFVSATAAQAQEWPRVTLFGGGQVADFGTDIRLDATTTILGTTIDFERDLGFNETAAVAWATGLWRISRRNQVQMFWTRADRDVFEGPLQRDIRFGESTFALNADVDAFLDTWLIGGSLPLRDRRDPDGGGWTADRTGGHQPVGRHRSVGVCLGSRRRKYLEAPTGGRRASPRRHCYRGHSSTCVRTRA